MTRGRWLQLSAAVVIVLGATLSGVRARQVWSESQAHGQLVAARSATYSALRRATQEGLYRSEVRPFQVAAGRVDGARVPTSSPFWSSTVTSFYHRQAAAYRNLTAQVNRSLAQITRHTRQEAGRDIAALSQAIGDARSLDLDVRGYQTTLSAQQAALNRVPAGAGTPGQYRSIARKLVPAVTALGASVATRKQVVSELVQQARNSTRAVQQSTDAQVAAAQGQIGLLGLLTPRAAAYAATLRSLQSAVHAQHDAFTAAVKEADLRDAVSVIQADFSKTIPSKMIVVSTENQSAQMYENGKQIYSTPVTTGGPELPTDHGVFHIYLKISPFVFHSPWPPSSPYYYPPTPIQYWMPFDGGEGLHDASWRSNFGPGSNLQPTNLGTGNYILGTHGCVNLPLDAATFVWNWAPVGTTVVVV